MGRTGMCQVLFGGFDRSVCRFGPSVSPLFSWLIGYFSYLVHYFGWLVALASVYFLFVCLFVCLFV